MNRKPELVYVFSCPDGFGFSDRLPGDLFGLVSTAVFPTREAAAKAGLKTFAGAGVCYCLRDREELLVRETGQSGLEEIRVRRLTREQSPAKHPHQVAVRSLRRIATAGAGMSSAEYALLARDLATEALREIAGESVQQPVSNPSATGEQDGNG